jgi:hypothetical protein
MRSGARIKRIEKKVYDGKNIIFADILRGLPKDKANDGLRQLLTERLPHRGPVSLTEILDVFPEGIQRKIIQKLRELSQ